MTLVLPPASNALVAVSEPPPVKVIPRTAPHVKVDAAAVLKVDIPVDVAELRLIELPAVPVNVKAFVIVNVVVCWSDT